MKIFLSALENGSVNLGEKSLPYLLARKKHFDAMEFDVFFSISKIVSN